MTPEKQRIKIAEACGKGRYEPIVHELPFVKWKRDGVTCAAPPPDYLNDLNAMHEAEMYLTEHTGGTFANDYPTVLEHIVDPDRPRLGEPADPDRFDMYTATAAQRAEAVLKTLGLWTEEE